MKILLDHNLPKRLRLALRPHFVFPARQMGWDQLANGELLAATEEKDFNLLLTSDHGIYYQQNNAKRRVSVILLTNNEMEHIEAELLRLMEAIERVVPGSFEEVAIPLPLRVRKDPASV